MYNVKRHAGDTCTLISLSKVAEQQVKAQSALIESALSSLLSCKARHGGCTKDAAKPLKVSTSAGSVQAFLGCSCYINFSLEGHLMSGPFDVRTMQMVSSHCVLTAVAPLSIGNLT